jgi:hypothetical protein
MTDQQPQRPMIPLNPIAVPQEIIVLKDGQNVSMVVISPLSTTVVMMTKDAALKVADDIREKATGITVVGDIPGGGPLTVDEILNPKRRT